MKLVLVLALAVVVTCYPAQEDIRDLENLDLRAAVSNAQSLYENYASWKEKRADGEDTSFKAFLKAVENEAHKRDQEETVNDPQPLYENYRDWNEQRGEEEEGDQWQDQMQEDAFVNTDIPPVEKELQQNEMYDTVNNPDPLYESYRGWLDDRAVGEDAPFQASLDSAENYAPERYMEEPSLSDDQSQYQNYRSWNEDEIAAGADPSNFDQFLGAAEDVAQQRDELGAPVVANQQWTRSRSGCRCYFDRDDHSCACCHAGGCQCPRHNKHKCVRCGDGDDC